MIKTRGDNDHSPYPNAIEYVIQRLEVMEQIMRDRGMLPAKPREDAPELDGGYWEPNEEGEIGTYHPHAQGKPCHSLCKWFGGGVTVNAGGSIVVTKGAREGACPICKVPEAGAQHIIDCEEQS